LSRDEVLRLRY